MPVPVSITNPGGLGLAAYQLQELPTVGPFARKAQAGEGARTGDASTSTQGDAAQPSPEVSASGRAPANGVNDDLDSPAVLVSHLDFSYPGLDGRPIPGLPPVVRDMSMSLPRGSLCLLVGPNGAGKTTLLKVLAGKHMVPESAVQVLGRPPFHDTALTMSGELSYGEGLPERLSSPPADAARSASVAMPATDRPRSGGQLGARRGVCRLRGAAARGLPRPADD